MQNRTGLKLLERLLIELCNLIQSPKLADLTTVPDMLMLRAKIHSFC